MAPSAYTLGGVATWLDYLLPALEDLGWHCTLVLPDGEHHNADAYLQHHCFPRVSRVRYRSGTREGRIRALTRTLDELSIDIVVGVNIPDSYEAVLRLRKHRGSLRSVMTVHAIQDDFFQDIRAFRSLLDGVVCTNRLAKQLALESGEMCVERVFYAPYGVEFPQTPVATTADTGPLRILYSGRLETFQKRIQDIPAILEQSRRLGVDFRLLVAGSGPEEASLRAALGEFGKTVEFLGHVPRERLLEDIYPGYHALLLTSFWETGPIVIWEAMARGLAVVSSRYVGSGLEGSLQHGENCLLFPIGDAESAAKCLAELRNPVLRKRLIQGGFNLVDNRYSEAASIRAWDECLRTILALPVKPHTTLPPAHPRRGRLDRILGLKLAEDVRELIGRTFTHHNPGSEWPHAYSRWFPKDQAFWQRVQDMDNRHHEKSH